MTDTAPNASKPGGDGRVSQEEMLVQNGAATASHTNETEADVSSPSVGASAASAQDNATEEDAVGQNDTSRTSRTASDFTTNSAMTVSPFKNTSNAAHRINKNGSCRVAIKKNDVYACTEDEAQRHSIPSCWPHSAWIYGTVVGGSSTDGWIVSFDIFPAGNKRLLVKKRERLVVIGKGKEEPPFNFEAYKAAEEAGEIDLADADPAKKSKKSAATISTEEFQSLDADVRATAKEFKHRWHHDKPPVSWKILQPGDVAHGKEYNMKECQRINDSFNIKEATIPDKPTEEEKVGPGSYTHNFFNHFFPSIVGHAGTIDEFHKSTDSPCYVTVKNNKIKFHDPAAADPDHWVKTCYLVMIAGASFVQNGIDNLFKSGPSGGLTNYPDFGKYVSKEMFEAFRAAAPFCWCDKKHWYNWRKEPTWDIFLPVLDSFNGARKELIIEMIVLLLDETMSGWRPKTTKEGGLPNICFEPRKPCPLGAMFRNGAEGTTKIIRYQDVQVCTCTSCM